MAKQSRFTENMRKNVWFFTRQDILSWIASPANRELVGGSLVHNLKEFVDFNLLALDRGLYILRSKKYVLKRNRNGKP